MYVSMSLIFSNLVTTANIINQTKINTRCKYILIIIRMRYASNNGKQILIKTPYTFVFGNVSNINKYLSMSLNNIYICVSHI